MAALTGARRTIAFTSFEVRLKVTADTPEAIERLPGVLPPGARPCPPSAVEESFGVLANDDGSYRLERSDTAVANRLDLELALTLLDNQLRNYIGLSAPNRTFIHAGVVAYEAKTIVLPGRSLAGKTTLVLELVRAGAAYYSDEFAVLDERGLVHPYPTAPVLHEPGGGVSVDVKHLGDSPGEAPLAIGTVVLTTYRPAARWTPTRLSPGRGAIAMLAHAPAALARPDAAMRVISAALSDAVVLEGERGEARELVSQLLSAGPTRPRVE